MIGGRMSFADYKPGADGNFSLTEETSSSWKEWLQDPGADGQSKEVTHTFVNRFIYQCTMVSNDEFNCYFTPKNVELIDGVEQNQGKADEFGAAKYEQYGTMKQNFTRAK